MELISAMLRPDHRYFHPLFTTALLVLGFVALALAQNQAANGNARTNNILNQLLAGKGQQIISQPVTLSRVTVQDVTQNDLVWVGPSQDNSVLVMLQPSVNPMDAKGNPTPFAAGDQVRVTGHVVRAPSPQMLEGWGVSPSQAARVHQQGVILQAVTFEVTKRMQ